MEGQCPDCGTTVQVSNDYKNGEIISCPCCGTELIVKIEIDGVSLTELPLEGEDWGE
jgi:lysine biosynthesis protein LysW